MAIARQRMSLEEFLALPEQEPAFEYWHGEVTQKVSPQGPHVSVASELVRWINNATVPVRLARAFGEARITLSGISTVPDLVAYRWDRIPRDARGRVARYFATPPDLAVEILSPGQSVDRLLERCRWYVENGVRLAIFVDPLRETSRLFQQGFDSGELRGADALDFGAAFPGLAMTVDALFAPLSADWTGD